jgi:Fic family protein
MTWNWQQSNWPTFVWNQSRLIIAEQQFLVGGGVFVGAVKHLGEEDLNVLTVESMSTEALTTSEIEGEILDRASVQSSIGRQLGLTADNRKVAPAERGISEMMVDLRKSFAAPLSGKMLFEWHRMLMSGRDDLMDVGRYRTSPEPMQVLSGPIGTPKSHCEAPPAEKVASEMTQFIAWFNRTGPGGAEPIPALARVGAAHLYFESIHPFEDGNGRIGRAIAEQSLAQNLGQPSLIALAATILARRARYYAALEAANKQNEITNWLAWFAGVTIEAQRRTIALIGFLIDRTKLLDGFTEKLNERQQRALPRMFKESPEGFKGGMSAGNSSTITGASPATTTRDLADPMEKGALIREGERRHARYKLSIPLRPVPHISVNDRGQLIEE